jgi:SNF2 family DNA or RNA helicase
MDPRTGKTKAILDAIAIQALRGKCRRVLVLTTIDGLSVWADEAETHFPFRLHYKVIGDPNVVKIGNSGPLVKIFAVNYDKFRSRARNSRKWEYPVIGAIEQWGPDIVVLDESHKVKRAGGVTSQAAWRSVRRMRQSRSDGQPFVVEATGTPNPKGWQDLFAQFRVMDDTVFGTAKSTFEDRYCIYGEGNRRYTIIGYRNLRELKRKVRAHSFAISEAKAFPDAPPQLWQNLPVSLPREARRIYEDMAEEMVADIGGQLLQAANIGARRIRLLQITGGFTTDGTQIHDAKLQVLESVCREYQEVGEPFILYARFLAEVEGARRRLERVKIPHHTITGETSRADRARARADLLGGSVQALLFQVATGSEAIDLATAHEVVFYSLPDGWKDYWQATRRVRGPKQTKATRYRHIVARGTLDRSVLNTLQAKGDMHAELMRSPKTFLFGI